MYLGEDYYFIITFFWVLVDCLQALIIFVCQSIMIVFFGIPVPTDVKVTSWLVVTLFFSKVFCYLAYKLGYINLITSRINGTFVFVTVLGWLFYVEFADVINWSIYKYFLLVVVCIMFFLLIVYFGEFKNEKQNQAWAWQIWYKSKVKFKLYVLYFYKNKQYLTIFLKKKIKQIKKYFNNKKK
jgi:hypothetical protein